MRRLTFRPERPGALSARRTLARLAQPPYRHAIVVIGVAIAMAALFVVSYTLALARPSAHHVPAAVVGPLSAQPALVATLQSGTHDGLRLIPYPSSRAAEVAMEQQRVYAALILDRPRPVLLIASAAGVSVSRVLEQAAGTASDAAGRRLVVHDVHPLPPSDPLGLVAFYVTLAATILGFTTMFQLRANASALTLGEWLTAILALAVVGGLMLTVVSDPLIGALRGPFPELWAVLGGQIAVAALFNSTLLTLIGRWAIVPSWGLLVALGNASSGGAVAPPLLPAFFRFVGSFLPTGAAVETLRNAVYFRGAQHLEPILVESGWIVAGVAALALVARVRGHTPATA